MAFQSDRNMLFVTVGYIEWRKGQDILVDAIKMMPETMRKKCEFLLVGQDSSVMAQKIRQEIDDVPQIKMIGKVDRRQMKEILEQTDVMICPSREDPMPTVAAEAMAFGVPCILSDATGTASYIADGVNGLIFASEDSMQLMGKICWCIEHKDEVTEMGKSAERIYREIFSMEVFERNLLAVVDEMIKTEH